MGNWSAKINGDNAPALLPKVKEYIVKGIEAYGAVEVTLTKVTRTIAQNALWHAQIGEIAKQTKFNGSELTPEGAKEYLVLVFAFELEQDQRPLKQGITQIPSRKSETGWMPVPPKTSKFDIDEGSEFIEWLFAYGAERGVRFNDKVTRQYEEYMAMS